MRAFILAGGLGTRLRSVVNDRPKPLAPVGSMPFLEHQLRFLKANSIREFVFCVGYRHDQIREYFADGRKWGVSIAYSVEDQPLGTAGALKHAEGFVNDTFLVLNGDTFFDLNLQHLVQAHHGFFTANPTCLGTLALTTVDDPSNFGSVAVDQDGTIVGFREKSAENQQFRFCAISAGVYILEPRVFELIPACQNISLERDTFPHILSSEHTLFGHRTNGFFVDIGTPEGYQRFQQYAGEISL